MEKLSIEQKEMQVGSTFDIFPYLSTFPRFVFPTFPGFQDRCKAQQHSKRVVSSQAEVTAQHEVNVDAAARERAKSSATFCPTPVASWPRGIVQS